MLRKIFESHYFSNGFFGFTVGSFILVTLLVACGREGASIENGSSPSNGQQLYALSAQRTTPAPSPNPCTSRRNRGGGGGNIAF